MSEVPISGFLFRFTFDFLNIFDWFQLVPQDHWLYICHNVTQEIHVKCLYFIYILLAAYVCIMSALEGQGGWVILFFA